MCDVRANAYAGVDNFGRIGDMEGHVLQLRHKVEGIEQRARPPAYERRDNMAKGGGPPRKGQWQPRAAPMSCRGLARYEACVLASDAFDVALEAPCRNEHRVNRARLHPALAPAPSRPSPR